MFPGVEDNRGVIDRWREEQGRRERLLETTRPPTKSASVGLSRVVKAIAKLSLSLSQFMRDKDLDIRPLCMVIFSLGSSNRGDGALYAWSHLDSTHLSFCLHSLSTRQRSLLVPCLNDFSPGTKLADSPPLSSSLGAVPPRPFIFSFSPRACDSWSCLPLVTAVF